MWSCKIVCTHLVAYTYLIIYYWLKNILNIFCWMTLYSIFSFFCSPFKKIAPPSTPGYNAQGVQRRYGRGMALVERDFWRAAPVVNSAGWSARNWVRGKGFVWFSSCRPDIHGIQIVQATQGKTPISMVNPLNALSMIMPFTSMRKVSGDCSQLFNRIIKFNLQAFQNKIIMWNLIKININNL